MKTHEILCTIYTPAFNNAVIRLVIGKVEQEGEEEEEEIVSIKEETEEDDLVEVQVDFCNSQPLSPRLIGRCIWPFFLGCIN